jgi:hypothetical protein
MAKDAVDSYWKKAYERVSKCPKNIPRAANSFVLYRSYFCKQLEQYGRKIDSQGQTRVSCDAATVWKALPEEERAFWTALASNVDAQHKALFPGYKFNPRNPKDIKRRGLKAKLLAGKDFFFSMQSCSY